MNVGISQACTFRGDFCSNSCRTGIARSTVRATMRCPARFLIPLVVGLIPASLAQDTLRPTPCLPTATDSTSELQQHVQRSTALFLNGKLTEASAEANLALCLDPTNDRVRALLTLVNMGRRAAMSEGNIPPSESLTTGTQPADLTPRSPAVVLRKDTPIVFRLSGRVTSSSKPEANPTLQVVQDLKVGESIVVKSGSLIEFSVDRQSAGNQTEPGIVILEFKRVLSITGNEIPLAGEEPGAGEREDPIACDGEFCFPSLFVYILKGHEGKLPKDLLMAAYVKDDVDFDAALLEKFNHELEAARQSSSKSTSTKARVHFYFNMLDPKQQPRDTSLAVSIDGTKIGTLKPWYYACAEVTAGTHSLRVGKESFVITLKQGEHFIRVQQDAENAIVTFSEGYEIYDRPLRHGSFNKSFAVDCWKN